MVVKEQEAPTIGARLDAVRALPISEWTRTKARELTSPRKVPTLRTVHKDERVEFQIDVNTPQKDVGQIHFSGQFLGKATGKSDLPEYYACSIHAVWAKEEGAVKLISYVYFQVSYLKIFDEGSASFSVSGRLLLDSGTSACVISQEKSTSFTPPGLRKMKDEFANQLREEWSQGSESMRSVIALLRHAEKLVNEPRVLAMVQTPQA